MLARRSSSDPRSERLAARRRSRRRRGLILFSLLLLVIAGSFIWLTWQSYVRISTVSISGGDQALADLAKQKLSGTYFGIIPRDSIFFPPEHEMRVAILASDPGIAAVSISRSSFHSLAITVSMRVPIARWCGLAPSGVEGFASCYLFDASGFIYAATGMASSSQTLNAFALYGLLGGSSTEPLHATLAHASQLPAVFDFARQVGALGSPVATVTIRTDEVDDLLASGTRITYVLGQEEQAFTDLTSAKSNLNLIDGSLQYVDLRFPGKVYFKKKQ